MVVVTLDRSALRRAASWRLRSAASARGDSDFGLIRFKPKPAEDEGEGKSRLPLTLARFVLSKRWP
jgi:hypothetical protein